MKDAQEELKRFSRDTASFEEHHEELLHQCPDQWVAILNKQVIGTSADYRKLITDLLADGVPTKRVVFKHLTREEELWILSV